MDRFFMKRQFESSFINPRNCLTYLLILQIFFLYCCAIQLKCPLYQMHFEKFVGFRPPIEYLSKQNLLFTPGEDYFKYPDHMREEPSSICWHLCDKDPYCVAYVHVIETEECFGYSYIQHERYFLIDDELPLVADGNMIFYRKACLRVPPACKRRLWVLTILPGNTLVYQEKKILSTLVTRRECAERCLFEEDFQCLSASFTPSIRNNQQRWYDRFSIPEIHHEILGRCALSEKDKIVQPDAYRAAPFNEEYIENQCHKRAIETENCSYEAYSNSSFIYADAQYTGLTQKECQSICTHESKFYCQGATYSLNGNFMKSKCFLHSEDIISMGPRSLISRDSSIYMRRVKCLDVQVSCTKDEMLVKYSPKNEFRGKIYAKFKSKMCDYDDQPRNIKDNTSLRLPIGNETLEKRCGVLRAYEVTDSYQRTFISAFIVIQNNANVETQSDRIIKVGCISSTTSLKDSQPRNQNEINETEESPNAVPLVSEPDQQIEETSLLPFYQAKHPKSLPNVKVRIFDITHQRETNHVDLGQNLEFRVIVGPEEPDFKVTMLTANTEDGENYVRLINKDGCPTDDSVFPAFEYKRQDNRNILLAPFRAFKFAGTPVVDFIIKINFCSNKCPKVECHIENGIMEKAKPNSVERKRRSNREEHLYGPIYISTVMDNVSNNATFSDYFYNEAEFTLKLSLYVHGPNQTDSNNFMYGERGLLLVAGYGDQYYFDSFCRHQSLLIAVFIFSLILVIALLFTCFCCLQKYARLVP